MKETQLDRIERKVDENTKYGKAMYHRVFGNEEFKQDGLIDDVEKNTKYRKKSGWFITIFTSIGAGLMWFIEWIKEHI